MAIHIYPIVGTTHRPPARAIVEFLSIGTPLLLVAEPNNPYDPNAIAVWIDTDAIPLDEELESAMLGLGPDFSLEWLANQGTFQLGYIPKGVAAQLQPFKNTTGAFAVGPKGGPQVRFPVAAFGG